MKAAVLHRVKTPLVLEERPDPEPGPGQVVVALKAASLNRRDFWITQDLYPRVQCPVVLGSDGAGVVREIGPGVTGTWKGREVIIYPGAGWGPDPRVQAKGFRVLGMPEDGTLAEAVVVAAEQLRPKPEHLGWEQAAALALAGVTGYRAAVVQGGAGEGRNVLVTGIGGGVAMFALQFARAAGAKVFVTSSSPKKIEAALGLGAVAGYDYTADDWSSRLKTEHGPMDLIVDGAGGENYHALVDLAAPAGSIVSYGATAGAPPGLDLFRLFWKQLRIQGSTMGSPHDFDQMLQTVIRKRLQPAIDRVLPLSEVNQALELMRESRQFGKIVLRTG